MVGYHWLMDMIRCENNFHSHNAYDIGASEVPISIDVVLLKQHYALN